MHEDHTVTMSMIFADMRYELVLMVANHSYANLLHLLHILIISKR